MKHLVMITLGGGAGALSRYLVSKYIAESSSSFFPYGTMAVNLLGCLIIGILYDLFSTITVDPDLKSLLTIGFLGAFTTFSTYSLETINLLRSGEWKYGIINITVSNVLGLLFVVGGIYISRIIIRVIK